MMDVSRIRAASIMRETQENDEYLYFLIYKKMQPMRTRDERLGSDCSGRGSGHAHLVGVETDLAEASAAWVFSAQAPGAQLVREHHRRTGALRRDGPAAGGGPRALPTDLSGTGRIDS